MSTKTCTRRVPVLNQRFIVRAIGLFSTIILGSTGCVALPLNGGLPQGVALSPVSRVERDTPLAWDPSGENVAMVLNGLQTMAIATGSASLVSTDAPVALAWDSEGKRLAAALPLKEGTALRIFSREGTILAETHVEGHVTTLAWNTSAELLAFAMELRSYKFGSLLKLFLIRWNGLDSPAVTVLSNDTMLKPQTNMELGERLPRILTMVLSPLHDEILYFRMHDPPAFAPYLTLILRNLESGVERRVANVSALSGGAAFSPDGERLLYGNGTDTTRWSDPRGGGEMPSIPSPGKNLALSPEGSYLLLDGLLYRSGALIASFTPGSEGFFAPKGGRLLIRNGERLYLLTGLQESPPSPVVPAVRERLLTLHRWQIEGLISTEEYKASKERIYRK